MKSKRGILKQVKVAALAFAFALIPLGTTHADNLLLSELLDTTAGCVGTISIPTNNVAYGSTITLNVNVNPTSVVSQQASGAISATIGVAKDDPNYHFQTFTLGPITSVTTITFTPIPSGDQSEGYTNNCPASESPSPTPSVLTITPGAKPVTTTTTTSGDQSAAATQTATNTETTTTPTKTTTKTTKSNSKPADTTTVVKTKSAAKESKPPYWLFALIILFLAAAFWFIWSDKAHKQAVWARLKRIVLFWKKP